MIKPSKQLLLAYEEVLKEKKKKVAVFSYGRLNPPTIGHEKLINKIIEVAKEKGGDAYLFVSHKQNNKTDPLFLEEKLDIIKQFLAFQKNDIKIGNFEFKKINGKLEFPLITKNVLRSLYIANYTDVYFIVGDDRIKGMQFVKDYNNKPSSKNNGQILYNFNTIELICAGKRDFSSTGIDGMKAGKLRQFAIDNNFNEFKKGIPKNVNIEDIKNIFLKIRKNIFLKIRKRLGASK